MATEIQSFAGGTRNPFNYEKFEQIARDSSTAWLTLDEITNQLNLYGDESQDSYLASLELAARMHIEDYLGMSIFPTTYRVYYAAYDSTSSPSSLDLPVYGQGGVTISSVKYWNGSNVLTTVATSSYYLDATGDKIVLTSPMGDVNPDRTSPIVVEYKTVASPLAQYATIKQAGMLLIAHFYNNRSETGETRYLKKIPFGIEPMLRLYKPLVM
jgi:uncharacterized phiE125 gp8 family phage protein